MRIDDLISIFIPPVPLGGAQGSRRQAVLGIDTGGGEFSSGRRGSLAAQPVALASGSATSAPNINTPDGDRADLISLLASRRGLGAAPEPLPADQPADPFANGASVVDAFIRKRAILAYRFPQQNPYGPQIDLTFDVEVAYRVIDILPAGQSFDAEA
ncbi:MAG: hypothetical protein AB7K52_13355 [Phycisphaerales bacterium]